MPDWRPLTPEDAAYVTQGRALLSNMLSGAAVIEAP